MATPCSPVLALKVSLVGSVSVGKTSLAQRLCRGHAGDNNKSTIAGDWFHHRVRIGQTQVNLQIWDTAGQEKFRSVIPSYIRASAAALIVYDVTDARSFVDRIIWLKMVKDIAPKAIVVLVANKVDKSHRIITTQQGEKFANDNGLGYMETSAVCGCNVEELFLCVAKSVMTSLNEPVQNSIKLHKETVDSGSRARSRCSC